MPAYKYTEGTYLNVARGDIVYVHSYGRWYQGLVTKCGKVRVTVMYSTKIGTVREKPFRVCPGLVKKL